MFPFFETIRYSNTVAENLHFHQQRVERTFACYGVDVAFDLMTIDYKREAEKNGALNEAVYKCKIAYDLKGNYTISFEPYQLRKINTFTLVDIGNNDYSIKLTDRTWINIAVQSVITDDVIFMKNGILKDASYANIVLFDGNDWVTPINPLLLGTKRALLLSENKIIEKEIRVEQLKDFKSLKFINAMMLWEESPTIDFG
jgi:4-amino-4-deoxychorismate lyase